MQVHAALLQDQPRKMGPVSRIPSQPLKEKEMKIKTFRDDALAETGRQNMLLVRGVLVSYHLATNRIAPLHSSTEIEFKAGIIYKVFTGLSIEDVRCPFDIGVQ